MKKILTIAALFILSMSLMASSVFAQAPGSIPNPGFEDVGGGNLTTVSGWVNLLLTVVRWIYTIIFIVAVLFILIAAYNFITSKGDSDKVGKAKNQLIYAVIGIAVALLSYVIVQLVRNSLATGLS